MLLTSLTWGLVCGSEVHTSFLKADCPLLQDSARGHVIHSVDLLRSVLCPAQVHNTCLLSPEGSQVWECIVGLVTHQGALFFYQWARPAALADGPKFLNPYFACLPAFPPPSFPSSLPLFLLSSWFLIHCLIQPRLPSNLLRS